METIPYDKRSGKIWFNSELVDWKNAKVHIFMRIIEDTELILTQENKIYHLNLSKDQIADNIILVGDPERVNMISEKFDFIEHQISNREFNTHTGVINGKRISAISTGIGTDNIDIVINELDALVNVDFNTRTINKKHKSLNLIRLGTSGGLQEYIDVDSLVVSAYALGFDGLAHFYKNDNIIEKNIGKAYQLHSNWNTKLAEPYFIKSSQVLLDKFADLENGITATATGFYGPQGRELRLNSAIQNLHEIISSFNFQGNHITNFEMETSALYYLGRTLGHNTLTICAIIGNRLTKKYSKNYKKTVRKMIDIVLDRIC